MSKVINGIVHAYNHQDNRLSSVVEIKCETDSAAKTDEFKAFAHEFAMHVAQSTAFNYITLMSEPFVTDPEKCVLDKFAELAEKLGENVVLARFQKFELGKG